MDSFNKIPDFQKGEFLKFVQEQQMKDSLKMYNHLVEGCFDKCVMTGWGGNFTSKQLSDAESQCINNCSEKFMKLTQRVGFRFAEYQAIKNGEAAPPAK
ncbi:Tim10/DDP family zinc finger-domain-containing protein [Ochromonadaceae sp. CCMP2298]|nr:Tim10/DDP family zinc finger-domain-containing protein [Ochromonadaceae sp. CCMP2298]|mmetsp:Transcript_28981/g.64344  ORF Transcript_28981/g.64344 Transcript_28981/m.64344 type:complete len:99 (-) Transcript_28981:130-426(-)|eukprot:CAMPEP_0173190312 /NCGR_PEP_ID=MMETSP1141-20130122/12277_1 /TAXON_ID=483371 /ORGANISM="non described non described, Strain CCMP2298" /LENGTH=98 /DNA_ID=CAMNT_0014114411 /DNA_START=94 /DNA_END=390 /DNA_ORIENTATION=-